LRSYERRVQTLGYSLNKIGDLLTSSDNPAASGREVKRLTQAKIDYIWMLMPLKG
jgi:hypothetical protein